MAARMRLALSAEQLLQDEASADTMPNPAKHLCFFDESCGWWHALCSIPNRRARSHAPRLRARMYGRRKVMQNLHTLRSLIDSFPEHGDRPALLALQKGESERLSYAELA